MAIYRRTQQGYKPLTDKQIKREIMLALGLNPNDFQDQIEYRRQYDIIRKRVKNYNQLLNVQTPVRANELFYRITQRQIAGEELTTQQQQILQTTSINTNVFRRRIEAQPNVRIQTAFNYYEKQFEGLLSKYSYGRAQYYEWKNQVISERYIKLSTGEIISEADAKELKPTEYIIEQVTRAQALEDPREILMELSSIATELHTKQNLIYQSNKASYAYNRRNVGTS